MIGADCVHMKEMVKIMEYTIKSKNTMLVECGVKPYRTPEIIDKEDSYRKEIPLSVMVTVEDLGKTTLESVPKVILNRFAKSVAIEFQQTYRMPGSKDEKKYRADYDKLTKEINAKPQTFTVKEIAEKTSRAKKIDPVVAKDAEIGRLLMIFMKDYSKQFMKDAVDINAQFELCATNEAVRTVAQTFIAKYEKGKMAK